MSGYYHIPSRKTEATSGPSSWLNQPRDGFTAAMEARKTQMSNSPEAKHVSSTFILGHTGRNK